MLLLFYCFRPPCVAPVLPSFLHSTRTSRKFDEEGRLLLDLGDTVAKMKRDFGVDQVLAWHAMTGYWAGVEPEAPEMAPFEPRVTKLLAPKGIREVDPEVSSAGTLFGKRARVAHAGFKVPRSHHLIGCPRRGCDVVPDATVVVWFRGSFRQAATRRHRSLWTIKSSRVFYLTHTATPRTRRQRWCDQSPPMTRRCHV